ncbi:hypothetical protein K491DRAFT_101940 [Lophiostoma macrostomum CBS 122681]|uniref:Secreted protein n=1 Tax=Lophiostoma macrostomum CBS 122681 TaxID=1314788 RepID=A0A6A6STV3_9PLEO|nr:hypothetical protein K491DRAFT_101940 [Lophiostoma macrostomum CBS 122681]
MLAVLTCWIVLLIIGHSQPADSTATLSCFTPQWNLHLRYNILALVLPLIHTLPRTSIAFPGLHTITTIIVSKPNSHTQLLRTPSPPRPIVPLPTM